ncbi:MAG TPA: hypothetical protein VHT26_06530 [Trebonia sp.]|nr:hypothetical protein [Trebonia sp.]
MSSPPKVSFDFAVRAPSPAASSPSAFQRKVVRRRSSAPMSCDSSLPASGGSQGKSVMSKTLVPLPDIPRPQPRSSSDIPNGGG